MKFPFMPHRKIVIGYAAALSSRCFARKVADALISNRDDFHPDFLPINAIFCLPCDAHECRTQPFRTRQSVAKTIEFVGILPPDCRYSSWIAVHRPGAPGRSQRMAPHCLRKKQAPRARARVGPLHLVAYRNPAKQCRRDPIRDFGVPSPAQIDHDPLASPASAPPSGRFAFR